MSEAGKRLIAAVAVQEAYATMGYSITTGDFPAHIAAIEAEAVVAERTRIAAAVKGDDFAAWLDRNVGGTELPAFIRRAILDIVEGADHGR